MLVDSHSHLANPFYQNNLDTIITDALQNDVRRIITIGCSLLEARASIEIAEKYPEVFAAIGLYPRDSKDDPESGLPLTEKLKTIEELSKSPKVVGIGECGLDFSQAHHEEIDVSHTDQIERFERQILLAGKLEKPLIIHSRNAVEETIGTIRNYQKPVKAVWHCFSESLEVAEKVLNLGLNISFTGNITYPKNLALREAVKFTPIEKIMIETDSPYLIPQAARNAGGVKFNSPQYVKMIAEEIASIKGISFDEVASKTTSNAQSFFFNNENF